MTVLFRKEGLLCPACSPLVRVGLALLAHVVGSGLTEMESPHGHLGDLLRGKIDPTENGQSAQE